MLASLHASLLDLDLSPTYGLWFRQFCFSVESKVWKAIGFPHIRKRNSLDSYRQF